MRLLLMLLAFAGVAVVIAMIIVRAASQGGSTGYTPTSSDAKARQDRQAAQTRTLFDHLQTQHDRNREFQKKKDEKLRAGAQARAKWTADYLKAGKQRDEARKKQEAEWKKKNGRR